MAEESIKLPIQSTLSPTYYQDFHCLAQDCRDSCCVNWNITFDKKNYLRLRHLDAPPDLQERLERGVRRVKKGAHSDSIYGRFDLDSNGGRCPFLDEDGLCAIQRACGHDALPHVCTSFPRKVCYTPAAKECTLSPACEGVLQLLWDLPGGVEFIEDPLPNEEKWRKVAIPGNEPFHLYFAPIRGVAIDILQNRAMPLTERMLCLGIVIQRLQKEDWENFDPDAWEKQVGLLIESGVVANLDIPGNQSMYLLQNLNVLDVISLGKEGWTTEVFDALEAKRGIFLRDDKNELAFENTESRISFSQNAYTDALAQFKAAFSDNEYFFENLMVAVAMMTGFPKLSNKEDLWQSYVALCSLYSFYRFVSVLGCRNQTTKEQLFHLIAMASRQTLHGWERFNEFQEQLFQHESSTLAHMAILLRWD